MFDGYVDFFSFSPSLLFSWMFEHNYLDTCCLGFLIIIVICMCFAF